MSSPSTREAPRDAPVGRSGWRRRPTGKVVFLGVLLVVLVGYTEIGFEMEWRTTAGRIGPGFFPRIIGLLAILLTLISIVQAMRRKDDDDDIPVLEEDEMGEADLGRHPVALVATVLAAAALVATLTSLGAIVASALFMFGMLWFLNRGHLVTNIVLSLALPIGLYVLLQTLLNAGLPAGILPRF